MAGRPAIKSSSSLKKALLLRDLDKYLIKKYPVKLNKKVFDQVRKSI